MIDTVATSIQAAAAGRNCNQTEYTQVEKRWLPASMERWMPSLLRRAGVGLTEHQTTWCSTVEFSGVNYYNPYWRYQAEAGATNWLYVHLDFVVPPENKIFCEVVEAATPLYAAVAPEFAGEDVAMEEDIQISCDIPDEPSDIGTTG